MKTREHDWYDSIKHEAVYGVQVRHNGQWKNASIDGKLILCSSKAERDLQRARFKKLVRDSAKPAPAGKEAPPTIKQSLTVAPLAAQGKDAA